MPSLLETKKKIESIRGTRKITKAMELVAASRMRGFQKKAQAARTYTRSLLRAIEPHDELISATLLGQTPEGYDATLFVIVTSDKGLCGPLNYRLLKTLWESDAWRTTSPEKRFLVTVGKKSAVAAKIQGITPVASFSQLSESLDVSSAVPVIESILQLRDTHRCGSVLLIAPEYVNPFISHTHIRPLLPFRQDMAAAHLPASAPPDTSTPAPFIAFLEPSREELVHALIHQLLSSLVLHAFYELKASEYSSRMVAMKQATEAADTRAKELQTDLNKLRQAAITQQLAELVGGSIALD